jgi:UDP-2,3-diacylglucosamine hydrolase
VGKLGIIAGRGELPQRLAEHARATNRGVFVLGLKGFSYAGPYQDFDYAEAAMGEIGKAIRLLKDARCEDLVFAGTVTRPDLSALHLDIRGAALLPELLAAAAKGDDALLRVVLHTFEKAGFNIVAVEDVLETLLARHGPVGALLPSEKDWADIRIAADAAEALGLQDVGQGAVARDGIVIATETSAGTDRMLKDIARSSSHATRSGVLVKRPKPQQERRIDLPTIGEATVLNAYHAGLAGLAIEAEGSLVVDQRKVALCADRYGLFVYAFTRRELA